MCRGSLLVSSGATTCVSGSPHQYECQHTHLCPPLSGTRPRRQMCSFTRSSGSLGSCMWCTEHTITLHLRQLLSSGAFSLPTFGDIRWFLVPFYKTVHVIKMGLKVVWLQWILRFYLASRTEDAAPRSAADVSPASSAAAGPGGKVSFLNSLQTLSSGPFLLSTSPWSFFFLLIAEKRAGLCFKKKKKKLRGVLIWGMSALPCSPDLERVPSKAGQCINI